MEEEVEVKKTKKILNKDKEKKNLSKEDIIEKIEEYKKIYNNLLEEKKHLENNLNINLQNIQQIKGSIFALQDLIKEK